MINISACPFHASIVNIWKKNDKKIKILIQFVSFTWIWKKLTHCQSKDSLNSFFYFITKTYLQRVESTASHGFNQTASLDFNQTVSLGFNQTASFDFKRSLGFHMHFLIQSAKYVDYVKRHNIKHYNLNDLQCIVLIDSSSSHWKLTCSRHDIAEKLLNWC